MNGKMDEFDVVDAVDQRALRAYVESRGWQKGEPFGDLGSAYTYGNGDIEVFVPTSRRLADFALRTWETTGTIAEVEDRTRSAVLRDLLLSDVDRVQVRVSEARSDGSIPIETGAIMFQESRSMLLAAACSALSPNRVFRAGKNKTARAYLDTVRLGHTEPGSFVINLLSPVPSEAHLGLTSEPFPRKTVHKLVSGLKAMRTAADSAKPESAIKPFEDRLDDGVSANMCDAISRMLRAAKGAGIEISVAWALGTHGAAKPARVGFNQSDVPILTQASSMLKEVHHRERPNERIKGVVVSLSRQATDIRGRVKIKSAVDGSPKSIETEFGPDDYSRLTEAHNRRTAISVSGDLRREGQRWFLDNPRDLAVYDNEDGD